MQVSTSPTLVPLPFADSGAKNVIPEAASPTPGLASLTTGFPPVTMTPLAAGGIPPAGQDMNGVLNLITQTTRWSQAGGPFAYNSGFATDSNVNGYPQGAVISRADFTGQWISTADNNTVNPDTVGTNWVPGYNYGVTAITGLTNANVTLTPAQAAKNRITLAGTLTGNVQIILPTWTKDWTIVNNTTGAFTATAKTASGTGIAIPQDASPTKVTGDGTNITQLAENIAPATQSQHAVQFGQVNAGRLLRTTYYRNQTGSQLTSSVDGGAYANASSTFTALSNTTSVWVTVVGGGGGGGGAPATSSGQCSFGAGGGGGGFVIQRLSSGFNGATVTVGAGGSAPAGANGGSGGSSSFGASLSSTGGGGGTATAASAPTNTPNGAGTGGAGVTGATNGQGTAGLYGWSFAIAVSGPGGGSLWGGGGASVNGSTNGNPGGANGAGGSGASNAQGQGARSGGIGIDGMVIVQEYA